MDGMGLRGFGRRLRSVAPPLGRDRLSLTPLMIRSGGFHLHRRVDNKNQNYPGPTTHVITPHEDLDPGLVNLLFRYADIQPHRVGLCGHGEGESEEFPSRVSFRVHHVAVEG